MHLQFFYFVYRKRNSKFTKTTIGLRNCSLSYLKTFDSSKFTDENFIQFWLQTIILWSFFYDSIFLQREISSIDRLHNSIELSSLCVIENQKRSIFGDTKTAFSFYYFDFQGDIIISYGLNFVDHVLMKIKIILYLISSLLFFSFFTFLLILLFFLSRFSW